MVKRLERNGTKKKKIEKELKLKLKCVGRNLEGIEGSEGARDGYFGSPIGSGPRTVIEVGNKKGEFISIC